jgi:hypothetical protein
MCESYLTKTYSTISGASSCKCIGIAGCRHYNRGSFTRFLGKTLISGKVGGKMALVAFAFRKFNRLTVNFKGVKLRKKKKTRFFSFLKCRTTTTVPLFRSRSGPESLGSKTPLSLEFVFGLKDCTQAWSLVSHLGGAFLFLFLKWERGGELGTLCICHIGTVAWVGLGF